MQRWQFQTGDGLLTRRLTDNRCADSGRRRSAGECQCDAGKWVQRDSLGRDHGSAERSHRAAFHPYAYCRNSAEHLDLSQRICTKRKRNDHAHRNVGNDLTPQHSDGDGCGPSSGLFAHCRSFCDDYCGRRRRDSGQRDGESRQWIYRNGFGIVVRTSCGCHCESIHDDACRGSDTEHHAYSSSYDRCGNILDHIYGNIGSPQPSGSSGAYGSIRRDDAGARCDDVSL